MKELVIVKLGGSAITDKSKPSAAKPKELARMVSEIASAYREKGFSLLVVHGGGSFGHVPAKKYGLKDGFRTGEQKYGFAETHASMMQLDQLVVGALLKEGLPAVGVPPLLLVTQENKRIKKFDFSFISRLLTNGFVPVIFGDVVLDDSLNGSICSGDQSLAYLAQWLKPSKIVLGTDVDGVFTADPKENKNAKLIPEITASNLPRVLSSLGEAKTHDVTGGMKGKVSELLELSKSGDVLVINASKPGRFKDALLGKEVVGTRIRV